MTLPVAQDNGASIAGRYGIANNHMDDQIPGFVERKLAER